VSVRSHYVKKALNEWSDQMGAKVGAFTAFSMDERLLARSMISTLKRQLRKLEERRQWEAVGRTFEHLKEKLPKVNEGDLMELFQTAEFQQFTGEMGFTSEDLADMNLTELKDELTKFVQSSLIGEMFDSVIQLSRSVLAHWGIE